MPPSKKFPTEDQALEFTNRLNDIEEHFGSLAFEGLNRRVPARVVKKVGIVQKRFAELRLHWSKAAEINLGLSLGSGLPVKKIFPLDGKHACRLFVADHHRIGKDLSDLEKRMSSLSVEMVNTVPFKSPLARALFQPDRAIQDLRWELDDVFARQYPHQFDTHVYFP